jgi:predicted acetyltransferase
MGELEVDALTHVTVAATHRRRGWMNEMVLGSLEVAHERGDAVTVLIAAQWPIYGRFGYAPASMSAEYRLERRRSGSACPGDHTRVRSVDRDEFAEIAPEVFARACRRLPGQLDRDPVWWHRTLGGDGYTPAENLPHHWLVHEGENGPDGLLAWRARGRLNLAPPLPGAEVWLLMHENERAYRDLWAYLGGIDGVDEVHLPNRPVHEPVRWLLPDARTLALTGLVDFMWLRVLDVPRALGSRRYACPGSVVLDVVDDAPGAFAAGRYLLTADRTEVECLPTDRPADLEINQRALASIFLGGYRLAELPVEMTHERTPGARSLVDLMFSTPQPPWNATWF